LFLFHERREIGLELIGINKIQCNVDAIDEGALETVMNNATKRGFNLVL
jgi:hypothetical protein